MGTLTFCILDVPNSRHFVCRRKQPELKAREKGSTNEAVCCFVTSEELRPVGEKIAFLNLLIGTV
jgi:hypothetical protein